MNKLKFIESDVKEIFSAEKIKQLENVLDRKFVSFLRSGVSELTAASYFEHFKLESGHTAHQVQLRITLERTDGGLLYPVETVHCAKAGDDFSECSSQEIEEICTALLDFQDAYWSDYFESERDTFVPLDWAEHHFNGLQVFVRGFERNLFLEQEADRILAEQGFGDHVIQPLSSET